MSVPVINQLNKMGNTGCRGSTKYIREKNTKWNTTSWVHILWDIMHLAFNMSAQLKTIGTDICLGEQKRWRRCNMMNYPTHWPLGDVIVNLHRSCSNLEVVVLFCGTNTSQYTFVKCGPNRILLVVAREAWRLIELAMELAICNMLIDVKLISVNVQKGIVCAW